MKLILFTALLIVVSICSVYAQVDGINQECVKNCPSDNSTCCNCCDGGSTCNGNIIHKECCPAGASYCGCISNRAFCQGSVFQSNGEGSNSPFGTCFDPKDPKTESCYYEPSPNTWIVCPAKYTVCKSAGQFTCCGEDEQCITDISDSYAICQKKNKCPSECGTQPCCNDVRLGNVCYNPNTHHCVDDNPSGSKVLCGKTDQSCGKWCYDASLYTCNNGKLAHV